MACGQALIGQGEEKTRFVVSNMCIPAHLLLSLCSLAHILIQVGPVQGAALPFTESDVLASHSISTPYSI